MVPRPAFFEEVLETPHVLDPSLQEADGLSDAFDDSSGS
jgi:hypothetical protein